MKLPSESFDRPHRSGFSKEVRLHATKSQAWLGSWWGDVANGGRRATIGITSGGSCQNGAIPLILR